MVLFSSPGVYLEDIVCKYVGAKAKTTKLRIVYLKSTEKAYPLTSTTDNTVRRFMHRQTGMGVWTPNSNQVDCLIQLLFYFPPGPRQKKTMMGFARIYFPPKHSSLVEKK